MAKSKKQQIEQSARHILIKTKGKFGQQLSDQLKIGDELLKRHIASQEELGKLRLDYSSWDNINAEILKQSFNNPNNTYHYDYARIILSPAILVDSGYRRQFQDDVDEVRRKIQGKHHRLKMIYEKIEHLPVLPELQYKDEELPSDEKALEVLENLLNRFHKVAQAIRQRHANRETIVIKDEYDVQDLLRGLLKIYFEDVREEDYVSSYAGSNSRVDFVLKDEQIVIETKMTNEKLNDKEIGSQLLIDIGRYRNHSECKTLVCFIYDKGDHIINKAGLIKDLERMATVEVKIRVFVTP